MRKMLLTLFIALTLSIASAQTAPDFTFTDIDGNAHTLSTALEDGKVIIIDFFFVNCGPCVSWAPEIDQLIADFEDTNVEVWSISDRDSDSAISSSVFNPTHDNHKAGGSAGSGDDIVNLYANNFNFTGFPTFAVVCTDGSITWDIWPLSTGVPEIRNKLTEDCGVAQTTRTSSIPGFKKAKLFPNPASDISQFEFVLDQPAVLTIDIMNAFGQKISSVPSSHYISGNHQVNLNVANLPTGIYYLKVTAGQGINTYPLNVVR
jgi:thiol-disulfide isomerase/thioredoxin